MRYNRTLFALVMTLSLIISACGPTPTQAPAAQPTQPLAQATHPPATQATQPPPPEEPAMMMEFAGGMPLVDPLAVSGDIVSAGSSTVFPLTEAMAARF